MTASRETILAAAGWLAETPKSQRPRSAIIELRNRFGLIASEAVEAIREANVIRARAA